MLSPMVTMVTVITMNLRVTATTITTMGIPTGVVNITGSEAESINGTRTVHQKKRE